jgi:hypothetical protein
LPDLLDRTDAFYDEREHQVDDDPIDGDDDSEDSLASVDGINGNQTRWAAGDAGDREGDGCADDREGDELQHGGEEHDGAEPGEDGEPLLGWTEASAQGQGHAGPPTEFEESPPVVTAAARARYKQFDRYATNNDGRHVDSERGFGHSARRIRNLSDRQRGLVRPKIDRTQVSC